MTDSVNNVSANGLYWQEKSIDEKAAENNKKTLDQEDFFSLLSQQLAYQDPFKPVDNAQMVAQMASFTTAEGIDQMSKEFATMNEIMSSTQALQASGLVGKSALVPAEQGYLAEGKAIEGVVVSGENMTKLNIRIEDSSGNLVKVIDMGSQEAGNVRFSWDGTDAHGNRLPEGSYKVKANASIDGQSVDLPVANSAHIESVSLAGGTNGVVLNLQGMGSVRMSDVLEVGGSASKTEDSGKESDVVADAVARLKAQLGS